LRIAFVTIPWSFQSTIPQKMAYKKYRSKSKNAQGKQSRRRRGGINPANKRYLELQIKTLQNAHRDADKLRQRLKAKEREKQRETTQIEVTQKG
jgi:hypothetical protein